MSMEAKDNLESQQMQDDLASLMDVFSVADFNKTTKDVNGEVSSLGDEIKESIEAKDKVKSTPTTSEILRGTGTYTRIENIIANNPEKFVNIEGNTPQEKVETIFNTIRSASKEFLKNRLGDSEHNERIIDNVIAPALEWNMLNLLATQNKDIEKDGQNKNKDMLESMDTISFDSLFNLFEGVRKFGEANKSYNEFSAWMNAIDYLSIQEKKFGILNYAENSEILSNPLKFQEYLNNSKFSGEGFSVYENISLSDLYKLFGIDQSKTFVLGISENEETAIKKKIGNIQVESVDSVSLIGKLVGKGKDFIEKSSGLQIAANHLLDGLDSVNGITKNIFDLDIVGEFSKPPENRNFLYRILDFVCKLIGITGGLDGIVKNRRLDKLNLGDKTDNIVKIFETYRKSLETGESISVVDEASCQSVLAGFEVTDPTNRATTKGDFLRDSIANHIADNMTHNIPLGLSPIVVQQILGDSYVKKESVQERGKTVERLVVDETAITEKDILKLAHNHMVNMKNYLEGYNDNDLKDFYAKIHNTDDLAICMIASLYADKNDVIEGVKAEVFMPENYRVSEPTGVTSESAGGRENLSDSVDTSNKQMVSERWVYDKAVEYGITDNRQIAYVLSTIKGESWFKNQKEVGGEDRSYGKIDAETGKAYYGRGFIQITHKDNYRRYSQIIRNSGRDFKDNDGNIIKCTDVDLVNNPDIILQSNDLAIFIAMDWMKNGGPYRAENKRLDYYINDNKLDYYNARIIINGMSSKPQDYANDAQKYLEALSKGSAEKQPEGKDSIFVGPELLAHNKDEIGGIGNSIMVGFQGYKNKLNFPNMDGEEGKSTKTHPRRFNSILDVQGYKAEHPSVKSFMFYFGANTNNNEQTLSDIRQWAEWFQEEGIQPVLCTCIGEDRHTWLTTLNESIRNLGKDKNWPVFDFAGVYNKGDIAMGGGESPHPTSVGYTKMADLINEQLNKA